MALTARIAALAQAVGADIKALTSALAGKSDASHNHDDRYSQRANNLSDLSSAAEARDNLGLGNAATADFGTGSGGVARGNHSHSQYLDIVSNTGYAPNTDLDSYSAGQGGYGRSTQDNYPPGTGSGLDIVTKSQYGTNDLLQIALPQRSVSKMFMRTKSSAGWGDWFEFYHTENFDPSTKVDKVAGKGLSSNDYSNSDKSKLAAMPRIEIVSELPAQEDPDTLYLVFPDESS